MLEDTLVFDYHVLTNTEFRIDKHDNCLICQHEPSVESSAPFFFSDIPTDQLVLLMKEKYSHIINSEDVEEHRKHISPVYDDEQQKQAKQDFKTIESDIIKIMKEEDVIESTIRGLYARRLMLEKSGAYGKEWVTICQTLNKWVELKLKKEKKIDSGTPVNLNFGEMIKIPNSEGGEPNGANDSGTATPTP